MGLSDTSRVLVGDRSSIGAARTMARALARQARLDEQQTSEALIVASELATNLVRHAGGGSVAGRAAPGLLTLLAWDGGPGIDDVPRAFDDGFSTSGTAGTGLGAIDRLAQSVEVRSSPGEGTVVVAHLGRRDPGVGGFVVDGLAIPLSGEGPCGDAFAARADGEALTLLLADGLGHGPHAAEAAQLAVARVAEAGDAAPAELLEAVHADLRRTRGAAVCVARLEPALERVRFAGVGNVAGVLLGQERRRTMLCHHGIVGREARRIQEAAYPLTPGTAVLLHTDGVRDGWDPERRPGMLREDPLVLAACVIRDHERGRDDVGVLLARARGTA